MRLAIETATHHIVVALGPSSRPVASVVREVVPGRWTPLLSLIDEAFADAGVTMADVRAIGVGTGPGSFTGLRAGLATAKTLCWLRGTPLVALPTDDTLRRAAALGEPAPTEPVAVVQRAGARDHYVALPGTDPVLTPPTRDLAAMLGDRPVAAIDLADGEVRQGLVARARTLGHPDPVALGGTALRHAPDALLAVMDELLAAGAMADPTTLVPRYVALPRGVGAAPVETGTTLMDTTRGEGTWSPTRP